MKHLSILSCVVLLSIGYLACRDASDGVIMQPEEVHSVKYVWKADKWYYDQIELWKEQVDKNPQDAHAWHNFYKANRYYQFKKLHTPEKQKELALLLADMGKAVPESYEYNYLMCCQTPNHKEKERTNYMFKAYEKNPDRHEIYYSLVDYYDLNDEPDKRAEIYKKIYKSRDIAPGLLNYNYNVLMSLEPAAILITHGDNDTYPIILLQDVFKVRPDVTNLNISLLKGIEGYFETRMGRIDLDIASDQLPAKKEKGYLSALAEYFSKNHKNYPVYFALTVYKNYLKDMDGKLHITGLAYKYGTESFDNLAVLKKNLETKLRLDYLIFDWYEEDFLASRTMTGLNMNYAVPALMLAEHYAKSGEPAKSEHWKSLAIHLGEKAGKTTYIEEYLAKKNF